LSHEVSSREVLAEATGTLVDYLEFTYKSWDGVKQFRGSANRLVRMYEDYCWSQDKIESELQKQFKVFPNKYSEMLVVGPIVVWTLCPHHLLPVKLNVTIGYIPNGGVLGLSKFARIADIMARRPVMQEQYSVELADVLVDKLNPRGVGVSIYGSHGCMTSRGVKQHAEVATSVLKGDFLKEGPTRQEFYSIVDRLKVGS